MKLIIFLLLIVLSNALKYKDLAGPPEEFGNYSIPNPDNNAYINNDIIEMMSLVQINNTNEYSSTSIIYIDTLNFTLYVLSPLVEMLEYRLFDQQLNAIIYTKELINYPLGIGNLIPGVKITPYIKETENYTLVITGYNLSN